MQRMLLLGVAVTVCSFSSAMENLNNLQQKARQATLAGWHIGRHQGYVKLSPSPLQTCKYIGDNEIYATFYALGQRHREMEENVKKETFFLTEQQYQEAMKKE